MNKTQILALIFVLVIVGSIIGFGTIFKEEGEPPKEPPKPPVTLLFTAKDINASVYKILPVIKIGAVTTITNIYDIDSSLVNIKEIFSIKESRFEKDEKGNLLYIAELILRDGNYNAENIIKIIEENTELKEIEYAKRAIIKVPTIINATNVDLNINETIALDKPFIEAIINPSTILNDKIKANIILKLEGKKVIFSHASEESNISLIPKNYKVRDNVKVIELKNNLVFSGIIDYNGFSTKELELDLNKTNAEFIKVIIGFEPIAYLGIFKKAINDNNKFIADFNAFLGSFNVSNIETSEDENVLFFNITTTEEDYHLVILKTNEFMALNNISKDDFSFKPIKGKILGELRFNKKDLVNETKDVKEILNSYGIFLSVSQPASVLLLGPLKVDSATYEYNDSFSSLLNPGKDENSIIELSIRFSVVRDNIVVIQGIEKSPLLEQIEEYLKEQTKEQ